MWVTNYLSRPFDYHLGSICECNSTYKKWRNNKIYDLHSAIDKGNQTVIDISKHDFQQKPEVDSCIIRQD